MALIRAGQLRHLVTIEAPTEQPNDYGEPVPTWGEVATVWASKHDLTGREAFAAQQVNAEVTTRFTIRHRQDVTAKMRLHHSGAYYGIESVQDPDGHARQLYLICTRNA